MHRHSAFHAIRDAAIHRGILCCKHILVTHMLVQPSAESIRVYNKACSFAKQGQGVEALAELVPGERDEAEEKGVREAHEHDGQKREQD